MLFAVPAAVAASAERAISCLGRLEPKDGVINVAGPSTGTGVIRVLKVEEGDWVEAGDELALQQPLSGTVERSELRVGRLDVLGTDPVAKTDARVEEVHILLDDGADVGRFTDLQVEVEIAL
jgi:multidrug efflux pump subunit AcrA (membrane-fusion protein)